MIRRLIISVLCSIGLLILNLATVQAQDPQFAQYYNNPLYLNPAMTGLDDDIFFGLNYRSQWKSLDLPYEIAQLSMIYPIMEKGSQFKHRGGFGFSAYRETAGESNNFTTNSFTVTAAYNLYLKSDGSQMISVGLQGGMVNKQIDFNNLRWGSQYNPFIGFDSNITPSLDLDQEATTFPIFNAGAVWFFDPGRKNFRSSISGFLGFAVSNINRPDESLLSDPDNESLLPRLYKAHAGLNLNLSRDFSISPNVLYMSQNSANQLNAGLYFTYQVSSRPGKQLKMQLGTWYRFEDAMIVSFGILSKNLGLGVSYDYNNSSLRGFTNGQGALEASITYRITKGKGLRRFSTPLL
ncbi:MAG: PorP/SprF family type IX secretion system membrane protein [Cyclobacteriaceae bacterium]|nr:PorP/SprF family type IX secretion system membrane protein [Cyclobacteriaceae bacterium]